MQYGLGVDPDTYSQALLQNKTSPAPSVLLSAAVAGVCGSDCQLTFWKPLSFYLPCWVFTLSHKHPRWDSGHRRIAR